MIGNNILDLIGHTPLLKLNMKMNNWKIYLKLEKFNPGQSMKDRMALNMIEQAEKRGDLKPGGTIIESSSGNTATGLAIVAAVKGYKFIAVVDHHASEDKIKIIKAYGGQIVMVGDSKKADEVAVVERENKALELSKKIKNSYVPKQHENVDNRGAYIDSLAKELIDELVVIDLLYGSIGTGGSICGTALGMRKYNSKCRINAVEPVGSIIFGGKGGPYFQSGTGNPPDAEIPPIIDYSLIDNNFYASDKEAFNTCRYIAKNFGVMLGGSGGGVLYKALEDINSMSGSGTAVVIVCDGGEKYLDSVFNDCWMKQNNMLDPSVNEKLNKWLRR
ncbi:MAG TPA: cysteine synthase [Clostridiales bacterium]|nr:cysteine synthase [Clostridiales bacterium]